jgi:Dockerin type I domain
MTFRERNLHIKTLFLNAIIVLLLITNSFSNQIHSASASGNKGFARIVNCPGSLIFDHCRLASYEFKAKYPAGRTISFKLISGPGVMNSTTGVWSYSPTIADVRSRQQIVVAAVDEKSGRQGPSCTVYLGFRNSAPYFEYGCGETRFVSPGDLSLIEFMVRTSDCDPIMYFLKGVTPTPVGTYWLNTAHHELRFEPDYLDAGKTFTFTMCVTDGKDTSCCVNTFVVDSASPYRIMIETTHNTYQGILERVDVTLARGSEEMGGFDFVISYDAVALSLSSVVPDSSLFQSSPTGCGWEYFTYRFSPFGNCGNICATGKVRVVSIAETNNGPFHPTCFLPNTPSRLFYIDFLVTDNRTYACQFLPINFVWFDCGDNTISSKQGDELYVSRIVWDPVANRDIHDYTATGGYPTFSGAQDADCYAGAPQNIPTRFIDFVNGGIDVACVDTIDMRGDIDMNEYSFEVSDAVLFSKYFVYGTDVFTINLWAQIALTDVNADDTTLTIEDLMTECRRVVGDAPPLTKPIPSFSATLKRNGTSLSIDQPVGAAWIWAKGNVTPELLAKGMEMLYNFDGEMTKILIWGGEAMSDKTFAGDFIKIPAPIVFYDFATYEGFKVDATYSCCLGTRGDANGDGRPEPNLADISALTAYVVGKPSNICLTGADVNGDGAVNVTDLANLVAYIFNKGPAPVGCP